MILHTPPRLGGWVGAKSRKLQKGEEMKKSVGRLGQRRTELASV